MAEKLAFEAGLSWAHSRRPAAMKPWTSVFTCLGLNFLTSVQLRLGNTRQCPAQGPTAGEVAAMLPWEGGWLPAPLGCLGHLGAEAAQPGAVSPTAACHVLMTLPLCNQNPPFSAETPWSKRVRRRQWYLNTCLYLERGDSVSKLPETMGGRSHTSQ